MQRFVREALDALPSALGALTAIIIWTVSGRAGQIAQTLCWVAFLAFAIAEEIFRRKTGERE